MTAALVNHPMFGSLWLERASVENGRVVGEVLDTSGIGSPYYPEDYHGTYEVMNFPLSCVRKWAEW